VHADVPRAALRAVLEAPVNLEASLNDRQCARHARDYAPAPSEPRMGTYVDCLPYNGVVEQLMPEHRIFSTKFSSVYPLLARKVERKGRNRHEVDRVSCCLTGYS
jgi:hypothetical protein